MSSYISLQQSRGSRVKGEGWERVEVAQQLVGYRGTAKGVQCSRAGRCWL